IADKNAGRILKMPTVADPTGQKFHRAWGTRLQSLKNIPPVLKIIWDSSPAVVTWGLILRAISALSPLALLAVARLIIDAIVRHLSNATPLRTDFWWLVGLEFGLACFTSILNRIVDYCDTLLADKFIRHISVRIMHHASRLDLASYEDPLFHDKLERARVQATDRLGVVQQLGRLVVLTACVVPAFLGKSHFAFLGYAQAFRQTPIKRQIDYLRFLGASKDSAKELKLFGLSKFLTDRFQQLSDDIYKQNVSLAKRRLLASALLSLLTTIGYYGAYAYVILETVEGHMTVGTLTFLTGAIAGASANLQMIFSTFSSIADQSLFLTDLLQFFAVRPTVFSKPNALKTPRPIKQGIEFRDVSFSYPGSDRPILRNLNLFLKPDERIALIGENGEGKTTIVKLLTRLYDPTAGQILLDGIDLREYDLDDYASNIAVIFQDFMRYDMTAWENIAVGQ